MLLWRERGPALARPSLVLGLVPSLVPIDMYIYIYSFLFLCLSFFVPLGFSISWAHRLYSAVPMPIPTLTVQLPAFLPTLLASSAVVSRPLATKVAERLRRLKITRMIPYKTLLRCGSF